MEKELLKEQMLTLKNREVFTADLVENVECFSSELVMFQTKLGGMEIRGKNLKLKDFSVDDGTIILEGVVDSVVFIKMKEKRSVLKGIFK